MCCLGPLRFALRRSIGQFERLCQTVGTLPQPSKVIVISFVMTQRLCPGRGIFAKHHYSEHTNPDHTCGDPGALTIQGFG